ncbi:unnamed protein product [Trichogramma brassicae]|uniref:Uncharacterized protein n=1 Tax=Trichogramma brassicae TaxID=86971 RepID=A0A6H5J0I5_9HYME|nr:unnamed protein product [Trichogramma brassicae]
MNDRRQIPTNNEARRSYSSTNEMTNKTTSHDFFKEGLAVPVVASLTLNLQNITVQEINFDNIFQKNVLYSTKVARNMLEKNLEKKVEKNLRTLFLEPDGSVCIRKILRADIRSLASSDSVLSPHFQTMRSWQRWRRRRWWMYKLSRLQNTPARARLGVELNFTCFRCLYFIKTDDKYDIIIQEKNKVAECFQEQETQLNDETDKDELFCEHLLRDVQLIGETRRRSEDRVAREVTPTTETRRRSKVRSAQLLGNREAARIHHQDSDRNAASSEQSSAWCRRTEPKGLVVRGEQVAITSRAFRRREAAISQFVVHPLARNPRSRRRPSNAKSLPRSNTLKSLTANLNWCDEKKRLKFIQRLENLIRRWNGQTPRLRAIFLPREIDRLLSDCIINRRGSRFISIVAGSGYKDEPELDQFGKPQLRRTTALHLAAGHGRDDELVRDLFQIYHRVDVNCIDETGLTHLHVACMYGFYNVVRGFLKFGQDPDCLVLKTGDSPLHLALRHDNERIVELLLRRGSNPNLQNHLGNTPLHVLLQRGSGNSVRALLRNGANPNFVNENGSTPLHVICHLQFDNDPLLNSFFEICQEDGLFEIDVNESDELGQAPLHVALKNKHQKMVKILLEKGADANMPLCVFREKENVDEFAELSISRKKHRPMKIDAAEENSIQTPLQLAVAKLLPDAVLALLNSGADLSRFEFPTEICFIEKVGPASVNELHNLKLRLASQAMCVVDNLEKKGYEMVRGDAMVVMNFFSDCGLFENSKGPEKCLFDDEEFATEAKKTMEFLDDVYQPDMQTTKKCIKLSAT